MAKIHEDLAASFAALKGNAHWGQYVRTLQEKRDAAVRALLHSDHPDEAKRGEARAYDELLRSIATYSKEPTT